MGPAGHQLRALLWKSWLCRVRTPVLSLAEFLWPCILCVILIVLRLQEPPRHRDNCYLQPRDLPSQGVLPFVQSLLCNTGATCRNRSWAGSTERPGRTSRLRSTAGHRSVTDDLVFLQDMQDVADEVCGVLGQAVNLKTLWEGRSTTPGSPRGSGFLTQVDLSRTEEVISKLESLQRQPQIWDFLRFLPGPDADTVDAGAGLGGGARLLQAVRKVLNSTKELLMRERKLHALGDEQMSFLLWFVEFLEKSLLSNHFTSPSSPTETVLYTGHSWISHLMGLEGEPPGPDTQKLLEFGREIIEQIQRLEKKESISILRLTEKMLFATNPMLQAGWAHGILKGDSAESETLSARLDFPGTGNEGSLSKSFNFSQLFRLGRPRSAAVRADFTHLSETVLNRLHQLGFLGPEQVSGALGTVRAVRVASGLLAALPERQKQEVGDILTHLHQNLLKDKDSAFLLRIYSLFHQYTYEFLGKPSRASLLPFLTQSSKPMVDIIKQFDFENIRRVFAFLHETTELLGGISELSHCQQLLSVFSFLELRGPSLVAAEGPVWEATRAALAGLKQLILTDEGFRVSLFQYVDRLVPGPAAAALGSECFAMDNGSVPSTSSSSGAGPPFARPWAQALSSLSVHGSRLSEWPALRCSVLWLQMWTEVWGSVAQVLRWDRDVFTPLRLGLSRLLDEPESGLNVSESCQGLFPTYRPSILMLHLLKNLTRSGGFRDWDGFLTLRGLWAELRGAVVRVQSLPLDQVERSLFAVETALRGLAALPVNSSASGQFLHSLRGVFMEPSNTSESRGRRARLATHFLPDALVGDEAQLERIITDLRETILLLRNVSHDQGVLFCADSFQKLTELILDDDLLHVNTSQRMLHTLAVLNSSFFSEDAMSGRDGCIRWVDTMIHLHGTFNLRFPQGHLQGVLRDFRDLEDKINSTLMLVTWLLNTMEPGCPLNKSNINCVNIYLKNVTDFLNVILAEVFEKEEVPKFEILLTLLRNSTNQVRMSINHFTGDFEFAVSPDWKRFAKLILPPVEMSDEIPSQFQNVWLHLVVLGKEVQDLVKDIFPNIWENTFSSTSAKEKDINHLGYSLFHLASHLAFNFMHNLQNSPTMTPHEIKKVVGLGIQLIRDAFNSLMLSVPRSIPEGPGNHRVLKKVTSFLLALKKAGLDLLVDQLEQAVGSLMDFPKNTRRPGSDSVGLSLLVGLVERFAGGSRTWDASRLLRLSHLLPHEDVKVAVGLYYALPHAAGLLQRGVGRSLAEALTDIHSFTLFHGTGISNVTKEAFAALLHTLLDIVALTADEPRVLAEAVTCLPAVWCHNHTTSGVQHHPKLGACNGHFQGKAASILGRLHLSPPGEVSQCSNESARMEVTEKMVCVIHGLVDGISVLLELSEVFRVKMSVLKRVNTVQGFWQKVLSLIPSSGNQSTSSISGLCPSGPIKQVALQIIETLKNVNFTQVTADGSILDELAALSKFFNKEGTEASLKNTSLNLARLIKSLSGDQSLVNNTHSLVSFLTTFLKANISGRHFKALSGFLRRSEAVHRLADLWLESEEGVAGLTPGFSSRPPLPETNEEAPVVNSVALPKITSQLARLLENLSSSLLQALAIAKHFPSGSTHGRGEDAGEEYSRRIPALFLLVANESSPDDRTLWTAVITTFLGYCKNISAEGTFDVDLTQLANQEQPSNVSALWPLLESFLTNSINNFAAGPQEAAWRLSDSDLHITDLVNLTLTPTQTGKGEGAAVPPGSRAVTFMEQLLKASLPFWEKGNSENKTSSLLTGSHGDAAETSAAGMGEDPQPPSESPAAEATSRRVRMLVLRVLLTLAGSPFLVEDVLCAALTRRPGGIQRLEVAALRGVPALHGLCQGLDRTWSSPHRPLREGLSRSLPRALGHLRSVAALDPAPQRLHTLAQRLQDTWFSGNPVMAFLSNFTVPAGVKVRDLMRNVTEVAAELRALRISDEAVGRVLEADVPHSQVLPRALAVALAVALSGRCDPDVLRVLLVLPEDEKSVFAGRELRDLPGATVCSLLVSLSRNLDLRGFVYKLMPADASRALRALLDIVTRLSRLLPKAGRVLERVPEFLRAWKVSALRGAPGVRQVPLGDQARASALSSFQEVLAMLCTQPVSFLGGPPTSVPLPGVQGPSGADKDKFSVPEDSTPFCRKLYQEVLQSPNGALVWSFLRPLLHGRILYAPSTLEIRRVIQKANHTFLFADKLRTLLETLLKTSSVFQSAGKGQILAQLQTVLRNTFLRNFVESRLHIDVGKLTERLQTFGGALDHLLSHVGTSHAHTLGRVLLNLSSCVVLDRFQGLESVATLEARAQELARESSFLAGVIFHVSSPGRSPGAAPPRLPPHVTYTIRTSVLYSVRTDVVENPPWKFHPPSLPADGFKYNYVFAPLQDMVERALVRELTGQDSAGPGAQTQAVPYPCHSSDLFLNNVGFLLPLIMVLTWLVSLASMVRTLVYEREIQLEEYLRLMGVHPATRFLAWFLEHTAVVALISAALAAVLKASGIFAHSDAGLVFLFLLDFGVSVVSLSYCLSALFRRAHPAALRSCLLYLGSFLPCAPLLLLRPLPAAPSTLLCLLSTMAFGQGVFFITFLEGREAGVQWGNMDQPLEPAGMAFRSVCCLILLDSGLYLLCGWYLSSLTPGAFGLRKPWYFPFTASYWRGVCGPCPSFFPGKDVGPEGPSAQRGEERQEGGALGVTLVSVTKQFQPNKAAVQDLTLTFHRDQITALLGTNGAGKTTVLSMLTGLQPPTSGTILIDGRDPRTDWPAARRELGVCLQRDVLLDRLTVREHLQLFVAVRCPRWAPAEQRRHVDQALRDTRLTPHQHRQARALSGGLRRRLSISAAIIGPSRTVVLDEPTSGVDPGSRRDIWDVLLRCRQGRTVIFTTHHLDEAELLSDRVAVLQRGRLLCCGTPSQLVQTYGPGLRLTLTMQPSAPEANDPKATASITSLVQTHVPRATLQGGGGSELSYLVPKDAGQAGFRGLFQALARSSQHLPLEGCGLADSSLGEVFLTLLQESGKQPEPELQGRGPREGGAHRRHRGTRASAFAQGAALLTRRLCHARRAWRDALSDLLLPVLFVVGAMGLSMVRPPATEYPPLKLSAGCDQRGETSFFSSGSGEVGLARVLLRACADEGLRCADLRPDVGNRSCWRPEPLLRPRVGASCGCLPCPSASARAPCLASRRGCRLLNLSASRLEDVLLLPSDPPRRGGWSFGAADPGQGADSEAAGRRSVVKVWHHQQGLHSLPSRLNQLSNLLLWRHLPPTLDWSQYGITLYSHPYGGALLTEDKILEGVRQGGVALCLLLGCSVLAAAAGSAVVSDRVTGAKRLQHLSGLGYGTYWFANFLYDMLFYAVSVGLCVTVIAAFGLPAFTFRQNLAATALLLLLFGFATLPGLYLTSRLFPSADAAFVCYVSLHLVCGLCTLLMTTVPQLLAVASGAQNSQDIYDVLKWAFTLLPQFCLGQGLVQLCYNQVRYDLTHGSGADPYVSPFEVGFLGWTCVQLAAQGSVLLLLRLLLHWDRVRMCRCLQTSRCRRGLQGTFLAGQDADVEEEQARVLSGRTAGDLLLLRTLSKSHGGVFRPSAAVRGVTLGVRPGECFGLLGANGAGKTTTFRMLSGDITPTAGQVVVRTPAGEDVAVLAAGAAGLRVGYCPQQDALYGHLTGREHLHYHCRLRGIPEPHIPEVTGDLVRRLGLDGHVDEPAATYSGGTRRKLSTALALLGGPDLLLLDEPSSGMDLCSKRRLWAAVRAEALEGCAVVLTSHSMEECEALCTRLAIMVRGSFRCLGSPQHLKNRFGGGYTVRVRVSAEGDARTAIPASLEPRSPGVQLKGQRLDWLEYHVPRSWACLADLVRVLEDSRAARGVRGYSIHQAALEQIFISFAAEPQLTEPAAPDPPTGGRQPPAGAPEKLRGTSARVTAPPGSPRRAEGP